MSEINYDYLIDSSGKNIYILGTAEYGYINVPTLIPDESTLNTVFGIKGALHKAYKSITSVSNNNNIYVCKVTGSYATCKFNLLYNDVVYEDSLVLNSIYANEIYNDTNIMLTADGLYIELKDKTVLEYLFSKYKTLNQLINAINKDTEIGNSYITASSTIDNLYIDGYESLFSVNDVLHTLSGGSSGLNANKNILYNSIKDTLEYLNGAPVDYIVFANCYIDDTKITSVSQYTTKDYLTQLIAYKPISFYLLMLEFCINQLDNNILTIGVIGFDPNSEKDYLYYKYYLDSLNIINEDYEKYVSLVLVTVGDLYYDNRNYIDNHCYAYLGLLTGVGYDENTSNKSYGKNVLLKTPIEDIDLYNLSNDGCVCVRHSPLTDTVHTLSAVTLSKKECFSSVYNIRILQLFSTLTGMILNENIGEKLETVSLTNTLTDIFDTLMSTQIISSHEYSIDETQDEYRINVLLYTKYSVEALPYNMTML